MSDTELLAALRRITTATITTVLLKQGIRRTWMKGPRPLAGNPPRIAGRAFTLRFVPAREDLATPASWSSPRSTRAAIEAMPAGCIAVIDAMGVTEAGVFGDILAQRMAVRGVAGLVTDGRCATWPACSRPRCRSGARAPRRRPRSPASPSSAGRSRSAAAASRSFQTT